MEKAFIMQQQWAHPGARQLWWHQNDQKNEILCQHNTENREFVAKTQKTHIWIKQTNRVVVVVDNIYRTQKHVRFLIRYWNNVDYLKCKHWNVKNRSVDFTYFCLAFIVFARIIQNAPVAVVTLAETKNRINRRKAQSNCVCLCLRMWKLLFSFLVWFWVILSNVQMLLVPCSVYGKYVKLIESCRNSKRASEYCSTILFCFCVLSFIFEDLFTFLLMHVKQRLNFVRIIPIFSSSLLFFPSQWMILWFR